MRVLTQHIPHPVHADCLKPPQLILIIDDKPAHFLIIMTGRSVAGDVDNTGDFLTGNRFILIEPRGAAALYMLGTLLKGHLKRVFYRGALLDGNIPMGKTGGGANANTMAAPQTEFIRLRNRAWVLTFKEQDNSTGTDTSAIATFCARFFINFQ